MGLHGYWMFFQSLIIDKDSLQKPDKDMDNGA